MHRECPVLRLEAQLVKPDTNQNEIILGVDTHLDTHVGAAINQAGRLLGTRSVSTNNAGYLDLLTWVNSLGRLTRAGVEGTGTYGSAIPKQQSGACEAMGIVSVARVC